MDVRPGHPEGSPGCLAVLSHPAGSEGGSYRSLLVYAASGDAPLARGL